MDVVSYSRLEQPHFRELHARQRVHRGTYKMIGDSGENMWIPDEENGPHLRLTEKTNKNEVGKVIDELICRPPKVYQ